MDTLRNWRDYLPAKEQLYLLLALSVIVVLALGIFFFVALFIVPNVRTRGELIAVVATAEQGLEAAEQAQIEAPATVRAQVATAQASVKEAANAFLSETQAAESLDRLYQYARESGVTIVELNAQSNPETGDESVYRLITFGLRVTGVLPRLVNFLARVKETALSGFLLTNVKIAEEDDTSIASMNVTLYTSPYADSAATEPITGVITPPVLPPLIPEIVLPTPIILTPILTLTLISTPPTLAPANPTPVNPTPINPTPINPTPINPVNIPTPLPPVPLPLPPAGCVNLINNSGFEVEGGWLIGQSAMPPQFTISQKYAGARAMQLGSPPTASALNRASYSSIRQLVTIPANVTVVTLRWWHWYGTAETTTADPGTVGDRQEVLLLTPDEKGLAVLQRVRRNEGAWQQETVDLTPYRGRTVYLYFNVFNDGNGISTWMYMDDVQLDTCSGTTPVPATVTPLPVTATNTPIVIVTATNTPPIPVTPATATSLPTTPTGCTNLLVNSGFEAEGSWLIGQSAMPPQFTISQKYAGARAMQLGSPPTASALNRASYSSIRQLVTIPANVTVVTLRWWHWYGTAETTTADPGTVGDRQEVLLLTPDEKVLAVLQRVRRNDGAWQQETVDLTPYRGRTVYLYFNVYNNGNGASTWAYVDDLSLDTCSGATPVPTLTTPLPPTVTNTPTTTPSPTTLATCVNLLNNGDFEADGTWLIEPSAVPPQITSSQQHAGTQAMQLGSPPVVSPNNPSGYSSIRQLVTIPVSASVVTLRWWHLHGTEETVVVEPGTVGDRQEVLLLLPDLRPLLAVQRVRRTDSGWQEQVVNLTAYRGQSIYIYFNVYNDGSGGRTWMYVDDVRLEVCSPITILVPTLTSIGYTCTNDAYTCSNFATQTETQPVLN